jgi:hypothetical protein
MRQDGGISGQIELFFWRKNQLSKKLRLVIPDAIKLAACSWAGRKLSP